jgi:hypothetical protein
MPSENKQRHILCGITSLVWLPFPIMTLFSAKFIFMSVNTIIACGKSAIHGGFHQRLVLVMDPVGPQGETNFLPLCPGRNISTKFYICNRGQKDDADWMSLWCTMYIVVNGNNKMLTSWETTLFFAYVWRYYSCRQDDIIRSWNHFHAPLKDAMAFYLPSLQEGASVWLGTLQNSGTV